MRKAIIAAIVATALFAVGAFAASFTVDAEDIASGSNAVEPCATNVDVDFNESDFDVVTDSWFIDSITVTFTGGTPADCVGGNATLVLQNNGNTVVFEDEEVIGAGDPVVVTFTPAADSLTVAQVWHASVLVDDLNIPVV